MSAEQVLTRLEDGGLASLVKLAVDHVLDQPVHALIDAEWLAGQVVSALETASKSDQTEQWFRDRIADIRSDPPPGKLRDHVPTEVAGPIREMVVRPFVPDREIIGRMLGHKAVEALVRELLIGAIQSFAKRFRPSVPGATLGLKSLKRMGKGVLGGVGQEIEKHAEGRVRDFVDGMLNQVLAQIADRLCNPRNVEVYGRFRGHLMDQILDTPMRDLDRELGKLDPDALVETGTAIARSLAQREGLREEVRALVQSALDSMGDTTIGAHLGEAGMTEEWRAEIDPQIVAQSVGFVRAEPFRAWLTALLDEHDQPPR
jgi:hypothetical protein